VEGDGRQSDHIVDERDSHVSQSGDGIVPVPRIPGLVRSGTPIEIEEEISVTGAPYREVNSKVATAPNSK